MDIYMNIYEYFRILWIFWKPQKGFQEQLFLLKYVFPIPLFNIHLMPRMLYGVLHQKLKTQIDQRNHDHQIISALVEKKHNMHYSCDQGTLWEWYKGFDGKRKDKS